MPRLSRAPIIGETLSLTIYSGSCNVETYRVTVLEVLPSMLKHFADDARVALHNGNVLRVSVSQLSV